MGDPRRGRPPAVYGLFVNVPTHFNVKLPLISGHLPNADSHLLVVSTCYNGQCKQMPWFSVVISTKNRWRAPKLGTDSSLKFPCCHLVIESDEPRDCGKPTPSLVTFVSRHHVGNVTYSVCSTSDVEEQNDS